MFKDLIARILGISGSIWSYIKTYVLPVLGTTAGTLIVQLAPTALSIVTEIEKTGDLSNAKRDAALEQLKSAAVTAGLDASTSVLNKLVEDAVQQLKASQATASAGNGGSGAS